MKSCASWVGVKKIKILTKIVLYGAFKNIDILQLLMKIKNVANSVCCDIKVPYSCLFVMSQRAVILTH